LKEETKKKKEKKQKKEAAIPEEIDEMDYLDAIIRENKRCGLSSCMTNIELFFW
jgi:hypothetical protein